MSFYSDSNVKIDEQTISVKGVIMPYLSNICFDPKSVEKIEARDLTWHQKLNLIGTQNGKTWWCFDAARPVRRKCFVVTSKQKIGPFSEVAFTVRNFEHAERTLKDNYPQLFS